MNSQSGKCLLLRAIKLRLERLLPSASLYDSMRASASTWTRDLDQNMLGISPAIQLESFEDVCTGQVPSHLNDALWSHYGSGNHETAR
jgi:hypothetical protein